MRKMNLKPVLEYKSVDYYHLPTCKEEEIFLRFSTYDKFVSMPYPGKEEALANKNVSALKCTRCNLPMFNHVRWFAGSSGNLYYSLAQCPRHGYVKGKIRIRKAPGEQIYIVKTVKPATEADVADIKAKKESVKEKRHKRVEREKQRRRRKRELEQEMAAEAVLSSEALRELPVDYEVKTSEAKTPEAPEAGEAAQQAAKPAAKKRRRFFHAPKADT